MNRGTRRILATLGAPADPGHRARRVRDDGDREPAARRLHAARGRQSQARGRTPREHGEDQDRRDQRRRDAGRRGSQCRSRRASADRCRQGSRRRSRHQPSPSQITPDGLTSLPSRSSDSAPFCPRAARTCAAIGRARGPFDRLRRPSADPGAAFAPAHGRCRRGGQRHDTSLRMAPRRSGRGALRAAVPVGTTTGRARRGGAIRGLPRRSRRARPARRKARGDGRPGLSPSTGTTGADLRAGAARRTGSTKRRHRRISRRISRRRSSASRRRSSTGPTGSKPSSPWSGCLGKPHLLRRAATRKRGRRSSTSSGRPSCG